MNIFFYAAGNPAYAKKLLDLIGSSLPEMRVIMLPETFPVSTFLGLDMQNGDMMILIPADRGEVEQLLTMQELLQDFRLILVLPDDDEETVISGHLLMPRFLTFRDSDPEELIRVMGRMVALLNTLF